MLTFDFNILQIEKNKQWLVPSKLPVNQQEVKLPVNNWQPKLHVRVHHPQGVSRNPIVTGKQEMNFELLAILRCTVDMKFGPISYKVFSGILISGFPFLY